MSREDKANRILTLMDHAPDRRQKAMFNLLSLSEVELDELLAESEKDHQLLSGALADWLGPKPLETTSRRVRPDQSVPEQLRSSDTPPWKKGLAVAGPLLSALEKSAHGAFSDVQKEVVKELLSKSPDLFLEFGNKTFHIDFDTTHIQPLLKNYSALQAERIVRDFIWLIAGATTSKALPSKLMSALHQNFSTIFEAETLVEHPVEISAAKATEGLAKIARLACEYAPDLIITTSSGGKILADFLRSYLRSLKSKFVHLDSPHGFDVISAGKPRRILIVDSTSRTGGTLRQSLAAVTERASTSEIRATCFAATLEAREVLGENLFFVPIISPTHRVTPPWNTSGIHCEEENMHIFGAAPAAHTTPKVFRLPKDFFDQEFRYTGLVLKTKKPAIRAALKSMT